MRVGIRVPVAARRAELHPEFHALLAAANLPPIWFHDLRHTAATLLLAQGVDPRTIVETRGHSQISLTLIVSLEQPDCVAFGDYFSRHVEPLQSRCGRCIIGAFERGRVAHRASLHNRRE